MTKPLATLTIGLCIALTPGCGRKGPLELPPGRGPMPVVALTAVPGDGVVILRWTNPVKAVSGKPVGPLETVEVWVFDKGLPAGGRPLMPGDVEKSARLVQKIPRREFEAYAGTGRSDSGIMTFSYAIAGPPSQLAFTVRVFDRKGRASDFAAPAAVDLSRKNAGFDLPAAEGVS